jgi:hypothetical protein
MGADGTCPRRRPARKAKHRGRAGRPPTGLRPGERLIDYKQVIVRLPPETVTQLETLSQTLAQPQWRVVVDAIAAYAAARVEATFPGPQRNGEG